MASIVAVPTLQIQLEDPLAHLLCSENSGTKEFAHEKNTKAPEGTTTGVTTGGTIGGALGALVGMGTLVIPGLGPFIGGPIIAGLAGIAVGGALGGLIGALVGMRIPEYEAKRYQGRMKAGGALLSVHCDNSDFVKRAKDMLKATGAEDIASTREASADFAQSDKPLRRDGGLEADYVAADATKVRVRSSSGGTE